MTILSKIAYTQKAKQNTLLKKCHHNSFSITIVIKYWAVLKMHQSLVCVTNQNKLSTFFTRFYGLMSALLLSQ